MWAEIQGMDKGAAGLFPTCGRRGMKRGILYRKWRVVVRRQWPRKQPIGEVKKISFMDQTKGQDSRRCYVSVKVYRRGRVWSCFHFIFLVLVLLVNVIFNFHFFIVFIKGHNLATSSH